MEASLVASPIDAVSSPSGSRKKFIAEYNCLEFKCATEHFRGILTSAKGNISLWLEGRTTKAQWLCEIDVANCGPSGVPEDTVVSLLHKGLKLVDMHDAMEGSKTASDDPIVLKSDDYISLVLSMCGGVWDLKYDFPLVPIAVDAVAMLEARVRDLEEENRTLREEGMKRTYFCAYNEVAAPKNANIDWRAEHPLRYTSSDFMLSEDGTVVTVKLAGLYELNVEVVSRSSANAKTLEIVRNGAAIAEGHQNNGSSYSNTLSIRRILELGAGDDLYVKHLGGCDTVIGAGANYFSLLRIGA